MRKKDYQIVEKTDSRKLAEFLCKDGQLLLPLVELITETEMALDELIDLTGRAAIEAVLTLSAQEVAGPKHPGRKAGEIRWHGRQNTTIPPIEPQAPCRQTQVASQGYRSQPGTGDPGLPSHPGKTHTWAPGSWRSS